MRKARKRVLSFYGSWMRDNHEGMPEVIDAVEKDGQYFGIVAVEIEGSIKELRFGVSQQGYRALRRILQLRPFDALPGLKRRYFFARSLGKLSDSPHFLAAVRVEQGKDAKQMDVRVPGDLAANLMWFAELKSFVGAAHLESCPSN